MTIKQPDFTQVIDIDEQIDRRREAREQGIVLPPLKTDPTVTATDMKDDLQTSRHSTGSQKSSATSASSSLKPASIGTLFRFATTNDIILFGVGLFFCVISSATMPAINIIFGDVVDAIAEPINVADLVNTSVRAMAILTKR